MSSTETKVGRGALTGAELVFAQRMLPHFLAGKSAAEAAISVLDDDVRIFATLCEQRHSYFADVGDGFSARTRMGVGDVIANQITSTVYAKLARASGSPSHGPAGETV